MERKEGHKMREEEAVREAVDLRETKRLLEEHLRALERAIVVGQRAADEASKRGQLHILALEMEEREEELARTRHALLMVEKILEGRLETTGQKRADELERQIEELADGEQRTVLIGELAKLKEGLKASDKLDLDLKDTA